MSFPGCPKKCMDVTGCNPLLTPDSHQGLTDQKTLPILIIRDPSRTDFIKELPLCIHALAGMSKGGPSFTRADYHFYPPCGNCPFTFGICRSSFSDRWQLSSTGKTASLLKRPKHLPKLHETSGHITVFGRQDQAYHIRTPR